MDRLLVQGFLEFMAFIVGFGLLPGFEAPFAPGWTNILAGAGLFLLAIYVGKKDGKWLDL